MYENKRQTSSHQQLYSKPDSSERSVGEQRALEANHAGHGFIARAQLDAHLRSAVNVTDALQPRLVAEEGVALLAVGDGEQQLGQLLIQLQDVPLVQTQHHIGLVQDAETFFALARGQSSAEAVALLAGLAKTAPGDPQGLLGRLLHRTLLYDNVEAPVLPEAPTGLLLAPQGRAHGCMLGGRSNIKASLTCRKE